MNLRSQQLTWMREMYLPLDERDQNHKPKDNARKHVKILHSCTRIPPLPKRERREGGRGNAAKTPTCKLQIKLSTNHKKIK